MEAKMFSLTVTDLEINDVLSELTGIEYPNSIKLAELTRIIFGTSTDIQQRKVRLAIKLLRKQGYLIIAKRGYSMAGDDPTEVIHFINGMYSRAHSLTTDADIMYRGLKQKYGDAVSAKVEQLPKQPMIGFTDYRLEKVGEPAFRKSIDARGNEIALQFDEDA
jgi:hypothetical protein